jgi:ATP-dependent DNA helicase RecQ
MAQPIVVGPETVSAAAGGESMPTSTAAATPPQEKALPAFAASDPVRVKRFGEGVVVAADAGSVTVEFADGSRRCFHPDYVSRRRAARAALAAPIRRSALVSLAG